MRSCPGIFEERPRRGACKGRRSGPSGQRGRVKVAWHRFSVLSVLALLIASLDPCVEAEGHYQTASVLLSQGHNDDALTRAQKAEALCPTHPHAPTLAKVL